ncbi:uncharacterized protein LOC115561433 isoform X2 [Gadus morhua]|uniref:uncharacterized protein LOC115561433 isoform X2 n=1 Tax=Gadus morhua TaxID=8049 RepID=UPI0011B7F9C1|nr:uncharacterized protein LOC115561433 isoform X2 [Gadus morhua]
MGFSHITETFSLMERLHHPWCQTGQTLSCSLPLQMIRMVHPLQLVHPLQMVHMAVPRQLTDVPRVPNRPGCSWLSWSFCPQYALCAENLWRLVDITADGE